MRTNAVWDDLTVHGFTCDLRKMQDVASENELNVKYLDKNLPRVMLNEDDVCIWIWFLNLCSRSAFTLLWSLSLPLSQKMALISKKTFELPKGPI